MPNVYQTVFGGNPVAPAIPTYLPLSFSVNTILGWPLESNITSPAVAEWIDCTATAPALTLQLSDARQVSTGYTAIFNNVGANTFSVLDAQGNTLMSPASGAAWILVLADNSTLQGTWRALQLGAGTSVANAAALAGLGLKAITTTLNERIFINAQGSNYTIVAADRAACVEWTGGSGGTFTLTAAGTLGSDWFCYVKNSGTGVLTVAPPAGTIDGTTNKTFNPNDSCIVVCDGSNFFTMGFGQSVASSFNFVTISLAAASGTVVLTGAQLNRISYKFTGLLAGNTVVQVPASIQQYWVDNETTGAFTLTISAGGAGSTFTVPQANRNILYCDGLNIVNAISSGAIQFSDGTAAAPSITFASDTTLGFYKAGADVLGISTAGVQRGVVNASGQWTINAPTSGTAFTVNGITGNQAITVTDGTHNFGIFVTATAGQEIQLGATSAHGLSLFTTNTNRVGISPTGNVTINAPSSGAALSLNFASGTNGFTVTDGTVSGVIGTGGGQMNVGTTNATAVSLASNGSIRVLVTSAGNVTINPPSSGTALTVNQFSSTPGIVNSGVNPVTRTLDTGANQAVVDLNANNAKSLLNFSWLGAGPTAAAIQLGAVDVIAISTNRNVTINAPSSGVALALTGVAGNLVESFTDGTHAGGIYLLATAGQEVAFGATSNHGIGFFTNNSTRIAVSNAGILTLPSATQPAFFAQLTGSSQNLPASSDTTVIFNTGNLNQGTNYATGTGIFTAPVSGVYIFMCEVQLFTNASPTNIILNSIYFSKNNSSALGASRCDMPAGQVPTAYGTNLNLHYGGSCLFQLAAGDTVRVRVSIGVQSGTTTFNCDLGSFFSGYLLG